MQGLPASCVLWQATDTKPYECDGLSMLRQLPMVVALPETEAQIASVLRICARMSVPVVARGAIERDLADRLADGGLARALKGSTPTVKGGYLRCYKRFLEAIEV